MIRNLAYCGVSEDEAYAESLKSPRIEAANRAYARRRAYMRDAEQEDVKKRKVKSNG